MQDVCVLVLEYRVHLDTGVAGVRGLARGLDHALNLEAVAVHREQLPSLQNVVVVSATSCGDGDVCALGRVMDVVAVAVRRVDRVVALGEGARR